MVSLKKLAAPFLAVATLAGSAIPAFSQNARLNSLRSVPSVGMSIPESQQTVDRKAGNFSEANRAVGISLHIGTESGLSQEKLERNIRSLFDSKGHTPVQIFTETMPGQGFIISYFVDNHMNGPYYSTKEGAAQVDTVVGQYRQTYPDQVALSPSPGRQ